MDNGQVRVSALHMLKQSGIESLEAGELQQVALPTTRSKLVQRNGGYLYGWLAYGLAGLFRKDRAETFVYGRRLCDTVRYVFDCHGFFTSDELPRYGLSRGDTREIFTQMDKTAQDGNLIILCAYDKERAVQIQTFLLDHFQQEIAAACDMLESSLSIM